MDFDKLILNPIKDLSSRTIRVDTVWHVLYVDGMGLDRISLDLVIECFCLFKSRYTVYSLRSGWG